MYSAVRSLVHCSGYMLLTCKLYSIILLFLNSVFRLLQVSVHGMCVCIISKFVHEVANATY